MPETARRIRAFGLLVAIRTDAPDLFDLLAPQLPFFPEDTTSSSPDLQYHVKVRPSGGLVVLRGRRAVATVPDVPAASTHLVADLQSALARKAAGFTFVHSGVVAIDGVALLLPGHSFAGKSTLVAALLRAGAAYGSDEFAVIDVAGRVHPYSRCLALRTSEAATRIAADAFGSQVVTAGLRAGAIVFTEFREGASLNLVPLPSGEVVLRLLRHCLGARGRPAETMRALQALARDATGFSSPRGDADAAAGQLIARARLGWSEVS